MQHRLPLTIFSTVLMLIGSFAPKYNPGNVYFEFGTDFGTDRLGIIIGQAAIIASMYVYNGRFTIFVILDDLWNLISRLIGAIGIVEGCNKALDVDHIWLHAGHVSLGWGWWVIIAGPTLVLVSIIFQFVSFYRSKSL